MPWPTSTRARPSRSWSATRSAAATTSTAACWRAISVATSPASPTVVVQNMVGAAGMIASNWLYNIAPTRRHGGGDVLGIADRRADPRQSGRAFRAGEVHLDRQHGRERRHLRRHQGVRHRQVRRSPHQGDDLRRHRANRDVRQVRAGGEEPARREVPDRLRLQGLRRREDRAQPRRSARHLRAAAVDHHVALARRLRVRQLPAGDPAQRQAGIPISNRSRMWTTTPNRRRICRCSA